MAPLGSCRIRTMKAKHRLLLLVDAIVNVLLGVLLLLFPAGMIGLLGMPPTDTFFYVTILGAVLLGIGVALLLELIGASSRLRGLGLGGAIAINLCGGGALLAWLVFKPIDLPLRGHVILWTVAIAVLGLAAAELLAKSWKYDD